MWFRTPRTRVGRVSLATLVAGALLTACLAGGKTTSADLDDRRGAASYYAEAFAGQKTASGEPFDPRALTAAHPSLPFGTRVRVTRATGAERSVVVRINDRGPQSDDRIIDLSKAAAQELGMIREGVIEVTLEVVDRPSGASDGDESAPGDGRSGGW